MNVTPIEWTTFSANPLKFRALDGRIVWACEKVSDGCKNCYAEDLSRRYGGARRAGDWNAGTMATLAPFLDEAELHKMLMAESINGKVVSGSRCFIGDMTDIFGEWVPDDLLNRLFSNVLEIRTDVTWQILTKRAGRLRDYLSWRYGEGRIPSRNIHVGVSVENQRWADERIPLLLQTPAAVRFISAEPLLGPVLLDNGTHGWLTCRSTMTAEDADRLDRDGTEFYCCDRFMEHGEHYRGIDWVIVGGESGTGARPCDLAWVRAIVKQCKAAGVPVFCKQMGSLPVADGASFWLRNRKGGNPSEWPAGDWPRDFPVAGEGTR